MQTGRQAPIPRPETERAVVDALRGGARVVTLTGLPGLGRRDLAHDLAERLGVPFVDAVGDGQGPVLAVAASPLGVAGEVAVPVPPLDLPPAGCVDPDEVAESPAGALLLAEASAAWPDFALTRENVADVVALVRALGGYPLALRLAGRRFGLVGPTELRQRWLREPVLGAELEEALEPFWRALDAATREALGCLSVLEPGFTAAAAQHLLDRPDALEVLGRLVRDGRLARLPGPRFALAGPLRARAARDVEDWEGLRDRHARFYVAMARSLERTGGWQPIPEGQRANLVAAVERALGWEDGAELLPLALLLARSAATPTREDLDLLARGLSAASRAGVSAEQRARLLLVRSRVMYRLGFEHGRGDIQTVLGIARAEGLVDLERGALGGLVLHHARDQEFADAERVLAALLALPESRSQPRAHVALGLELSEAGRHAEAAAHFEEALVAARRLGATDLEAAALLDLAVVEGDLGQLASAAERARRAADLFQRAGERSGATVAALQVLVCEAARGEDPQACALAAEQLDPGPEDEVLASRDGTAGILWMAAGRWPEAVAVLSRATRVRLPPEHRAYRGVFREALRAALALEGDLEHAGRVARLPARTPLEQAAREGCGALFSAAKALAATRAGDPTARLEPPPEPTDSVHAHLLHQAWTRAAAAVDEARRALAEREDSLVVARDGSTFRPPRGAPVDLSQRKLLGRLLLALAEARRDRPGEGLEAAELIALGWPGERILERAARNRLRVALTALRNLGLRPTLLTHEATWLLDPDVPLVLSEPDLTRS